MPAFFRLDRVRRRGRGSNRPSTGCSRALSGRRLDRSFRIRTERGAKVERVALGPASLAAYEGACTAASDSRIRLDRLSAQGAKCYYQPAFPPPSVKRPCSIESSFFV